MHCKVKEESFLYFSPKIKICLCKQIEKKKSFKKVDKKQDHSKSLLLIFNAINTQSCLDSTAVFNSLAFLLPLVSADISLHMSAGRTIKISFEFNSKHILIPSIPLYLI